MSSASTLKRPDYVIAVQAPAYALSERSFVTESAFAEHLKELRKAVGPSFARVVLIAPQLSAQDYQSQRQHLGTVDLERDEILYVPAHPASASMKSFWLHHARSVWRAARQAVSRAAVVHSGVSTDIWRPLMAMVNLAAWLAGKPIVFFVDTDFRQQSRDFYRIGAWSLKSYLVNRMIYDPLKWLQVWLSPRFCKLVLLKSPSMVQDFGRGLPHVRNFFDAAHSDEHVLSADALSDRLGWLPDPREPLRLVYFGRLASNKGIDRAVEAVRLARLQGEDVRFTIIGDGPCRAALQQQVAEAHLEDAVSFVSQVAYGEPLFEQLRCCHAMVAAPLVEDTPRAALDALARGIPIVAFDIAYFRVLAEGSGAVALASWPDITDLAQAVLTLSRDRDQLADMAVKAVSFARSNTQEAWLRKRMQWTLHFAMGEGRMDPTAAECASADRA